MNEKICLSLILFVFDLFFYKLNSDEVVHREKTTLQLAAEKIGFTGCNMLQPVLRNFVFELIVFPHIPLPIT